MHPLVWLFIVYVGLSVVGVWFQMNNMMDKLFPKIPKFVPFFGFSETGKGYYPVVFQKGWLFKRKYFELKEAITHDPDSAVFEAKVLIDRVIVPLHEHPIPKYPSKNPPK